MFTSIRPRPAEARPSLRPPAPARSGALITAVTGGPALAQAERLLGEFGQALATLFADVPGLGPAVLAAASWSGAPGEVADAYQPPSGRLLLAHRGPTAAGMVAVRALGEAPGAAELKRLYVRQGERGQGIARALLGRAIGEARRLGYRELRLETSPRMADALRLYRLAGFQPIPAYRARPAELAPHYLSFSLDLTRS